LAVDTTTPAGSVALLKNRVLLSEFSSNSNLTHSERLLSAIDGLFVSQNLDIHDIDAFALAVGPGSFTGIRIGVSTIKALALASGKPVAPVSTLDAYAQKVFIQGRRLGCPFVDAKKGEVYAGLLESRKGQIQELVPQGVYSPDAILSQLPSNRIVEFIGSGVELYKEKIFDYLADKARISTRSLFIAHEIGLLAYKMLINNQGVSSSQVKPLYFRRSQAEENNRKG
jgi:tRNA threonylcarbamoyladenosine biosynthesis protein TsaB